MTCPIQGWDKTTGTLVPWRQGFRHPTRNEYMGWFARISNLGISYNGCASISHICCLEPCHLGPHSLRVCVLCVLLVLGCWIGCPKQMSLKGVLVCGMHSRQCIVAYNGLVLVSIVENLVFENKITTNFFPILLVYPI